MAVYIAIDAETGVISLNSSLDFDVVGGREHQITIIAEVSNMNIGVHVIMYTATVLLGFLRNGVVMLFTSIYTMSCMCTIPRERLIRAFVKPRDIAILFNWL